MRLFAKSMALECAQAGDGIRVNSVHPGIIATPIWTKLPAGSNQPDRPGCDRRRRRAARQGRAGLGDRRRHPVPGLRHVEPRDGIRTRHRWRHDGRTDHPAEFLTRVHCASIFLPRDGECGLCLRTVPKQEFQHDGHRRSRSTMKNNTKAHKNRLTRGAWPSCRRRWASTPLRAQTNGRVAHVELYVIVWPAR